VSSTIQENTKVTSRNITQIQKLLAEGKGGILTVDPNWINHPSQGCVMYLYAQAQINGSDAKGWTITTKRGTKKVEGENYQTGWENDREYFFRRRAQDEETFPNMIIGNVAFFLGMHSTVSKGFGYNNLYLAIYIPKDGGSRHDAVCDGLMHVIDVILQMRTSANEQKFTDLWHYISQDLEDGKHYTTV
jgi:hypothetical protein